MNLNVSSVEASEDEARSQAGSGSLFLPLEQEPRAAVETACAAYHLNRAPQTLRLWACKESGPIRPFRINGRLAWPVDQLRSILRVEK